MSSSPPGQEPLVLVDFREDVARLTLNNPARKNAITRDMVRIIEQFCDRVESDETIGAAIIDARAATFAAAPTRAISRSPPTIRPRRRRSVGPQPSTHPSLASGSFLFPPWQ